MDDLDIQVVEQNSDVTIVRLVGSLDSFSANRLESIASALHEKGCRRIILSCEFLRYISSIGLKVLLEIARRLGMGTGLSLCGVNREIAGVLDLSGLLRWVLVYDDISQARRALSKEES